MEQKTSFKAITGRLIDATTVKNDRKRAISGKQCTLDWYKLFEYYLTIAWYDILRCTDKTLYLHIFLTINI